MRLLIVVCFLGVALSACLKLKEPDAIKNFQTDNTNTKILFEKITDFTVNGNPIRNIFMWDLDGANVTQLTTSPPQKEYDNSSAKLNNDETKIVFSSMRNRDSNGGWSDIYQMQSNGTNQTQLATVLGIEEWEPEWCYPNISGQLKEMVYFSQLRPSTSSSVKENYSIMSLDIFNNAVSPILSTTNIDYDSPKCSNNAEKLLFLKNYSAIYIADWNGQNEQPLTNVDAECVDADWSPDGMRIAHSCLTNRTDEYVRYDIFVMDSMDADNDDVGDNRRMIDIASFQSTGHDYTYSNPIWSPDGKYLIFHKNRSQETTDLNHSTHILEWNGQSIISIVDVDLSIIPLGSFISDWN